MRQVAPLRYDVIFKKAFSDPEIFTAFVEVVLGIKIEISKVETEKSFHHPLIRRIFDHIEQDQVSPEERFRMIEEYNQEQHKRKMTEEAKAEGKAEGEIEAKTAIARSLLVKGVDLALISEVTGLDREALQKLGGST